MCLCLTKFYPNALKESFHYKIGWFKLRFLAYDVKYKQFIEVVRWLTIYVKCYHDWHCNMQSTVAVMNQKFYTLIQESYIYIRLTKYAIHYHFACRPPQKVWASKNAGGYHNNASTHVILILLVQIESSAWEPFWSFDKTTMNCLVLSKKGLLSFFKSLMSSKSRVRRIIQETFLSVYKLQWKICKIGEFLGLY